MNNNLILFQFLVNDFRYGSILGCMNQKLAIFFDPKLISIKMFSTNYLILFLLKIDQCSKLILIGLFSVSIRIIFGVFRNSKISSSKNLRYSWIFLSTVFENGWKEVLKGTRKWSNRSLKCYFLIWGLKYLSVFSVGYAGNHIWKSAEKL